MTNRIVNLDDSPENADWIKGPRDEEPPPPSLTMSDLHVTDVVAREVEGSGLVFYSVLALKHATNTVVVQTVEGVWLRTAPWRLQQRWSLRDAGIFQLAWRVSPIKAVENWHRAEGSHSGRGKSVFGRV